MEADDGGAALSFLLRLDSYQGMYISAASPGLISWSKFSKQLVIVPCVRAGFGASPGKQFAAI